MYLTQRIVDSREGINVLETSAAIDGFGQVHIAYHDAASLVGSGVLRYARTLGNGSWKLEVADPTPDSGGSPSLALDPAGEPNVAYEHFDWSSATPARIVGGGLRLAFWDGERWNVTQVDRGPSVGAHASLGIDRGGIRKVAYLDLSNPMDAHLKYLEWGGTVQRMQTVATGLSLPTVGAGKGCSSISDCPASFYCDSAAHVCRATFEPYTSLALDAGGGAHVCFYDALRQDLRYGALQTDGSWKIETVEWQTVHGERLQVVGQLTPSPCPSPPTLGNHYEALLAFPSSASQGDSVLYRNGTPVTGAVYGFCGTQAVYVLASQVQGGDVFTMDYVRTDTSPEPDGMNCSLAVATDGTVHVAYLARVGVPYQLKYAVRKNGEWRSSIVDGFGVAAGCDCISGMSSSLALDPSQNPTIAYLDSNDIDLRVVRWMGAGWLGGTLDSANYTGLNPSIAFSPRGLGGVAYRERRFDANLGTLGGQRGILKFAPLLPFPPS